MKRIMSVICLAALLLGSVAEAATPGVSKRNKGADIDVTDLKIRFYDTPLLQYSNISTSAKSGSGRAKWAMLEITYLPLASPLAPAGWYDDVTMEGTVVLNSETRGKGDTLYVVFSGKTRFFTIQADSKSHFAMLLIPPKLMDRYFITNKNFSVEMFIAASVEFYGPGRVLLGEGYWSNGFIKKESDVAKARALMQKFSQNYSDVIRLRGGLYSKEKTPWAGSNYDYYDLIYDEVSSDGGKSIVK